MMDTIHTEGENPAQRPEATTPLPKLRPVEPQLATQGDRQLLVLRDPLQVSDKIVALPYELAPLLALCDGTRSPTQLQIAFNIRYPYSISLELVERLLTVCDEALLLDNPRYHAAQRRLLAEYRDGPYRRPALAGLSYPADAAELALDFARYQGTPPSGVELRKDGRAAGADGSPPQGVPTVFSDVRRNGPASLAEGSVGHGESDPATGKRSTASVVISPHIDYQRGGPVYAAVWQEAAMAVRRADVAVVFGTDHYGGPGELTLTRQSYATPFGVLPTSLPIVDGLAQAIGPERAFACELHHRTEHAIELAITWLHYVRRDLPALPVVPVLAGSFHHFVQGQGSPETDPAISALLQTLRELLDGHNILVVAGADLSHVGPAFDGAGRAPAERTPVELADRTLMDRMCECNAGGFFEAVRQDGDRFNVCGLSPIYLALRFAAMVSPRVRGRQIAYTTCPADEVGQSFVSICGVVLE